MKKDLEPKKYLVTSSKGVLECDEEHEALGAAKWAMGKGSARVYVSKTVYRFEAADDGELS